MNEEKDIAINGYMCDPFWETSVPAGKRNNTSVTWRSSDFEQNGITKTEEITGIISVYDEETYTDYVNESILIVPWN